MFLYMVSTHIVLLRIIKFNGTRSRCVCTKFAGFLLRLDLQTLRVYVLSLCGASQPARRGAGLCVRDVAAVAATAKGVKTG